MGYRSVSVDKFFKDFEEFRFGYFWISIFVDGLDELVDLIFFDLSISSQTLEGVVDEVKDLIAL